MAPLPRVAAVIYSVLPGKLCPARLYPTPRTHKPPHMFASHPSRSRHTPHAHIPPCTLTSHSARLLPTPQHSPPCRTLTVPVVTKPYGWLCPRCPPSLSPFGTHGSGTAGLGTPLILIHHTLKPYCLQRDPSLAQRRGGCPWPGPLPGVALFGGPFWGLFWGTGDGGGTGPGLPRRARPLISCLTGSLGSAAEKHEQTSRSSRGALNPCLAAPHPLPGCTPSPAWLHPQPCLAAPYIGGWHPREVGACPGGQWGTGMVWKGHIPWDFGGTAVCLAS